MDTSTNSCLTIVGTGISAVSQITLGARAWLRHCDVVFYAAHNPVTIRFLEDLNADCRPLPLPRDFSKRRRMYTAMSDVVLQALAEHRQVGVAFSGHPGVLVDPSRLMVARARQAGYQTRVMPGISAQACLFADLGLDPGTKGVQSAEATDFLIRPRAFDTRVPLILWQVSCIGRRDFLNDGADLAGLAVLRDYLLKVYPADHQVILYRAADLSVSPALIQKVPLRRLCDAPVDEAATLYIPPCNEIAYDQNMMAVLGMETGRAREVG